MATAAAIKTNILAYLNRAGATDLLETVWFEFAHREIQRRHNFKCMESTARVDLVADTDSYTEPVLDIAAAAIQVKEFKRNAHTWNVSTGKIVQFYHQTDYDNILALRQGTNLTNIDPGINPETRYFAWYAGKVEIWPLPDATTAVYDLRLPCWKFITAPTTTGTSWFSINADDYLMYRALLESVPFLGQPSDRVKLWSERAEIAFTTIFGHDVQSSTAGTLRARG
jgi:hypothetical protein